VDINDHGQIVAYGPYVPYDTPVVLLTPTCRGDLDGDDQTDQADLGLLLASYEFDDGGDLDGDGDTDQADLGILLADYGCGT
jgi:hypothetical protein